MILVALPSSGDPRSEARRGSKGTHLVSIDRSPNASFHLPLSRPVPSEKIWMMELVECYRCGSTVESDRLDLELWVVIHAWQDGAALFVCPRCQTKREQDFRTGPT